jgi:hypothetical protein
VALSPRLQRLFLHGLSSQPLSDLCLSISLMALSHRSRWSAALISHWRAGAHASFKAVRAGWRAGAFVTRSLGVVPFGFSSHSRFVNDPFTTFSIVSRMQARTHAKVDKDVQKGACWS